MAKGGKKSGERGRPASSGRSGKGSKQARVSGRGTTSTTSDKKAPKKFGQLSRKERDMMEEYGELVPQDFEEDESDRIGSFRKIVKESDLDHQLQVKREREVESDDDDEEDEYKLDRPSAFNKLIGMLKKDSKRQDEWKKRKLEEEGLEDLEDDDDNEEVIELTEAEKKALVKKYGKDYLKALDGADMDEAEEDDSEGEDQGHDSADIDEEEGGVDKDDLEAIAEEQEGSDDSDEEEHYIKSKDTFDRHFSDSMTALLAPKVAIVELAGNKWKSVSYEDPVLKRVEKFDTDNPEGVRKEEKPKKNRLDLESLMVKQRVQSNWLEVNGSLLESSPSSTSKIFTPLQEALIEPINQYKDLLFTNRTMQNAKEIRNLYVLHAINHVYKTRDRILKNSGKLQRHQQNPDSSADIPEFRDQGFTRPKVLVILPFKNTVVDVVESLIALGGLTQYENKKRFFDEFGPDEEVENESRKQDRPADFLETFKGNIDDHFRLGVKFTRKTLKLYADFYSADLILASPLGLKTVIGAEGDRKRDFDFLASIEVVIVDQTDDMLMQNWDHLETVFEYMNLIPKNAHGCDFSRVRNWSLDGRSKYVRQTLVFSNYLTPEINALFKKFSKNVAGKLKITQGYDHGSIVDVVPLVQQSFNRIKTRTLAQADDSRFQYFITQTLPQLRRSALTQTHTMIFIPSYFDFVRLRNYFTENKYSFAAICEYTSNANVSRARSSFFHGEVSFLLYTERFHYFRRYNVRGTFHLTFYGLPDHPQFYPEMLNLLALPAGSEKSRSKHVGATGLEDRAMSCTTMFTKYDLLKLQRIVGTDRANSMCKQEGRDLFVFT
ncbi:rRNA-binding ribosome biosynthesis protein utp25 [Modicella reniformis]|uniref:U3 small nucleolar RNA-associated protein 25 n=1 Tax=Modicella reniformis TaxID=1440133 RepID=A0A9P6SPR4_9FUNG|nr:rRNA-binding ribosome biosynthesis protein utp25 [Modicella reniformis]